MQTGNIFDIFPFTDPDGDAVSVVRLCNKFGLGGVCHNIAPDGEASVVPDKGAADTLFTITRAGDFTFVPGALADKLIGTETVVSVGIGFSDGLAADGTPSDAQDAARTLEILVPGTKAPNEPPTSDSDSVVRVLYAPDA